MKPSRAGDSTGSTLPFIRTRYEKTPHFTRNTLTHYSTAPTLLVFVWEGGNYCLNFGVGCFLWRWQKSCSASFTLTVVFFFVCIWVTRRYFSGIDERGLTVEEINSLMKFVDTDVSYSLDIAELRCGALLRYATEWVIWDPILFSPRTDKSVPS